MKRYAGIAQDRALAASSAGGRGIEPAPRSTIGTVRSHLRPRLLEAGLISAADFNCGLADGLAGAKWRLTEANLLDPVRSAENLSYMLGYKAGELERRSGGDARELAGGQGGNDAD